MTDRLDRGFSDLAKKMRSDYCTIEQVNTMMYRMNEEQELNNVRKSEY